MKLTSMDYNSWGNASMTIGSDGVTMLIKLDADDKIELEALAIRLFEKRQAKIVAEVAAMQPRLMAPINAEFTEVADDMPF